MQAEPVAGPAAFSAVCMYLAVPALSGSAKACGEEVCLAPWGFCCCLVVVLFVCLFTNLVAKPVLSPLTVYFPKEHLLHYLFIRVRKSMSVSTCVCRCVHVHRDHARASSCGDRLWGLLSRPHTQHTPSMASCALSAGESELLYPPNSYESAI